MERQSYFGHRPNGECCKCQRLSNVGDSTCVTGDLQSVPRSIPVPSAWRAIAVGIGVVLAGGAVLWLLRLSSPPSLPPSAATGKTSDPIVAAAPEPHASRGQITPDTAKGLWARPAPAAAARNIRRCGIGATLAPMGASSSIIERLSNGDISGVFSQLRAQAEAGDASAANQLDYFAHLTCAFAGINGPQSDFQASELLESNSLPPADSDWFRAVLKDRNAFNQQLVNICQQSLDKSEIDTWVTAAAARGDPASHYSIWMFGGTNIRKLNDAQLRAAALGGYAWAQFSLGSRTVGETPWIITGGEASDHPGDLLRAASQTIPAAVGQLARCEFTGCEYIAQDIPAAVADARSAAQQGSIDAMLAIGPQLQASQIDPDEVQAWQLINAGLQLQGYEGININGGRSDPRPPFLIPRPSRQRCAPSPTSTGSSLVRRYSLASAARDDQRAAASPVLRY
jgi:TPR repeat protein